MEWLYSRRVFSADLMKEQPVAALVNETYRVLSEGVNSSITQEVPKELTNNLRENTFRFSGFKTYHQMKEASLLLEDKKGGFKTYESFQRDVLSIDNRYNRQYLEAEYNFAVQSTQMAVKWKDYEKDGDDYNLQYRTANDGRVREEHAVLHGTTLPVDDPFWDKYYPPLGWNCRCTVVQVRKNKYDVSNSQEAIAAGERATAKPKQQIFRFNPGKTKNVFPPKHPYMPKGCGNCTRGLRLAYNANSEQCKVCMAVNQQQKTNTTYAGKQAKQEALEWAEKELPIVELNGKKARRLTLTTKDNHSIHIGKKFITETFAKSIKGGKSIVEEMKLVTQVKQWLPKATKVREEAGKHHPFNFSVYSVTFNGYTIEFKTKLTDGEILYIMKIL
ncbi:MAG: minor capsid protein [Paludibacteraceae bacterium]|nr:minor capsid protein [Paludibacteraceae bacterium]